MWRECREMSAFVKSLFIKVLDTGVYFPGITSIISILVIGTYCYVLIKYGDVNYSVLKRFSVFIIYSIVMWIYKLKFQK
jgi:hypothetical protein